MDERIKEALEFSQYRTTIKNQLDNLKHKLEAQLIYSDQGGQFKLTQDFLCFVDLMVRQGKDEIYLLDRNEIPIVIGNPEAFLKKVVHKYHSAVNEYFHLYKRLIQQRSVQKVIDG